MGFMSKEGAHGRGILRFKEIPSRLRTGEKDGKENLKERGGMDEVPGYGRKAV